MDFAGLSYGYARRSTAKNGGFWPGQAVASGAVGASAPYKPTKPGGCCSSARPAAQLQLSEASPQLSGPAPLVYNSPAPPSFGQHQARVNKNLLATNGHETPGHWGTED